MSKSIQNMFEKIASKYDLLNTILSFGIHHIWKNKCINNLLINKESKILDCATGTGDLAIKIKKKYRDSFVVGLDFTEKMINIAKKRTKNLTVSFIIGDILNLPFKTNYFDAITISFGIRNVDNTQKALLEMGRVVKPGGKIIILEFGQPKSFFKYIYKFYSLYLLPIIGKIISGDSNAYKYLPITALSYPCSDNFLEIMKKTNIFKKCCYNTLSFGIAYLYIGIKK